MRALFLVMTLVGYTFDVRPADSQATQDGRHLVHYHINPVVQPQSVADAVRDCRDSAVCTQMVDAAASAFFGAQPGSVDRAFSQTRMLEQLGFSIFSQKQGEDHHFRFFAGGGFRVCHVYLGNISIAPFSSDRSPQFATTLYLDRVDVTVNVPSQSTFKGRSWYDGVVSILYVPSSWDQRSDCLVNPARPSQLYVCKGGEKVSDHDPCYGSYWIPWRN